MTEERRTEPCAKCGSGKVVPLARMADQGQYSDGKLKAVVYTNPEAWIFKGAVSAVLRARICGDCGFTELYAEKPQALFKAWTRVASKS